MLRDNSFLFFFFQAEDGIRDYKVTGVQTCALPISLRAPAAGSRARAPRLQGREPPGAAAPGAGRLAPHLVVLAAPDAGRLPRGRRGGGGGRGARGRGGRRVGASARSPGPARAPRGRVPEGDAAARLRAVAPAHGA